MKYQLFYIISYCKNIFNYIHSLIFDFQFLNIKLYINIILLKIYFEKI